MPDYQIPITYVVSASATTPARGLEPLKLSTILLMTEDTPVTPLTTSYIIARTATAVSSQFGTETETAQQANIIFSQQPNILANNGYLIVAPYQTIEFDNPATAGTLTTPVLTTNLENFKEVTDGVLNLTIDSTNKQVTALDFSEAETLEDIAQVIQAKYTDVTVTVSENEELVFTSNTTGAASSVTVAAMSGGSGTDLYGAGYINGAAAVTVEGKAEEQGTRPETLSEAITRMAGEIYFEGILTTRQLEDDEAIAASLTVQALQNRIFPLPASTTAALTAGSGLFAKVQSNNRTKCLLYTKGASPEEAALNSRLFAAAYISRGFAVNYNGSNTTITMNLKDLVGVEADTNISETILNQCAQLGVDCFPSIEGLPKVVSNRQGTMYFDQVANLIWFVNAIQTAVFNTLATTQTKIPQTEAGMEKIAKAVKGVCNQAVTNGYIAPGTWNSPDTFGNYDDFMRNIEEFGYYQYHQPIAEQAQTERENRQAPLWQVAAKEAGAVHSANILITIEP